MRSRQFVSTAMILRRTHNDDAFRHVPYINFYANLNNIEVFHETLRRTRFSGQRTRRTANAMTPDDFLLGVVSPAQKSSGVKTRRAQ
jgi:hypothetical protein